MCAVPRTATQLSMIRSSSGRQAPHRLPAPHAAVTAWTDVAPDSTLATTVRSDTRQQEQTIMGAARS